jgi:hypothetical protein
MGHPFFKYEMLILSAFVERSISEELTRMRQERIRSVLLSAGNDQLFMADVMEIQQAFEHADHEEDAEIEALWVAEIQERYRVIQEGTVTCIPAEEAMRQARERS